LKRRAQIPADGVSDVPALNHLIIPGEHICTGLIKGAQQDLIATLLLPDGFGQTLIVIRDLKDSFSDFG